MQYTEPTLLSALDDGNFSFALGISPWLFGLLVLAIVLGVWFTYYRTTRPLTAQWKTFFITTRSGVLILILFCLLRPVITTIQTSPQETYLGILIDDSQSMSIGDLDGGQARQTAVEEALFENGLVEELAESFQMRVAPMFGWGRCSGVIPVSLAVGRGGPLRRPSVTTLRL